MNERFKATAFGALTLLLCAASVQAPAAQNRVSPPARILSVLPASIWYPAGEWSAHNAFGAPLSFYSPYATGRLTTLFNASFYDPRRRAENCLNTGNVGPPRPYRWAMVERWWENGLGFAPRDESAHGFRVRMIQNQSFVTYLYCLQNSPR